ncbi:17429_t:CDS:2, partial [Cetraspora pellucida]
MYELDESSEEEYENEKEIFYLTEEPEENENYQTTEDFYFMDNPWSDVESLNRTEISPTTNPDIEKEPEMYKDVQTAQYLEIVKQILHNRLPSSLLN